MLRLHESAVPEADCGSASRIPLTLPAERAGSVEIGYQSVPESLVRQEVVG